VKVVVVGAGPSGLAAALHFSGHAGVTVVDRIPVAGGESGWQSRDVQRMVDDCRQRGVELRLGATAMRWDSGRLLVGEPGRVSTMRADRLVYAGGLRPGTALDLGITGERPAGVLPATVAEHLLTTGVALWRRPVIVGRGRWATRLLPHLRHHGADVTLVTLDDDQPIVGVSTVEARGEIVVSGRDRVTGIAVPTREGVVEIGCDAVILAGRPQPNRNVDGAVLEAAADVLYVQSTTGEQPVERAAAATRILRNRAVTDAPAPERTPAR
jgi:NADPH-dependent 2,4-dienoyl-CoA reductase/sulfur reductase-like enzyme